VRELVVGRCALEREEEFEGCEARLREEAVELEDWRCEDCACRDRFELPDREELFLLRDCRDLSWSSANVAVPTSISKTLKTASNLITLFTETTSFRILFRIPITEQNACQYFESTRTPQMFENK